MFDSASQCPTDVLHFCMPVYFTMPACVHLTRSICVCQNVSHLPLLLEGAVFSAGPQDFSTAEDDEGREEQLEEQRKKQLE